MPPCHRSIPTCARCGEVLSLREWEACLRVLSAAIATDWPEAIRRLCHACVEGFLRNTGDFSAIPAARRRLSRQVASMKNKAAALAAPGYGVPGGLPPSEARGRATGHGAGNALASATPVARRSAGGRSMTLKSVRSVTHPLHQRWWRRGKR